MIDPNILQAVNFIALSLLYRKIKPFLTLSKDEEMNKEYTDQGQCDYYYEKNGVPF